VRRLAGWLEVWRQHRLLESLVRGQDQRLVVSVGPLELAEFGLVLELELLLVP
jgi:hypothetical protein